MVTCSGGEVFHFDVEAVRNHGLPEGLDDIAPTREEAPAIGSFEARAAVERP